MEIELIIFLTMLGVFLIGNFLFKLPVSLSMIVGPSAALWWQGKAFLCGICLKAPLCTWTHC